MLIFNPYIGISMQKFCINVKSLKKCRVRGETKKSSSWSNCSSTCLRLSVAFTSLLLEPPHQFRLVTLIFSHVCFDHLSKVSSKNKNVICSELRYHK